MDKFLQNSNVREDDLVLLVPVAPSARDGRQTPSAARSGTRNGCLVRVSSINLENSQMEMSMNLITDELIKESFGKEYDE